MQVNLFGILADLAGQRCLPETPDELATGQALREYLARQYPQMAEQLSRPSTRLVLNQGVADWQMPLTPALDIAIIPMVSGG